ncbi:MAG TPA: sugar ABC transporter permease [Anaerolineales bacterium]|nr:sugar ABC transporter permease [Anaerolineales bacterium]
MSIEQHTSKRGTTALHSGQTPGRSDLTVRGLIDRLANWDMGFVLPAVLVMVMLVIFPTLYALAISLLRWHLTEATPPTFAGLGNYLFLFTETRFWEALGRTLIFTSVSTLATLGLGMLLAVLLNRALPGKNLLRTLLIVPMVVTPVVVGLTWRFMYNPELGMINYFISTLGFSKVAFLGQINTSLASVIVTDVWQYTPFALLILLAGLESLPHEPFEAAQIDGASAFRIFWQVTLPMLRGPLLVTVLFRVMFSFNTFDTIYVMTGGGPGRSSETLIMYAYRLGFEQWHMGESAAAALFMLVLVTFLTRIILRILRGSERAA